MREWVLGARVVRVVDGDTIKLDLDLGFHVHLTVNARVASMNAPEMDTAPGERAKAYAEQLLRPGDEVTFRSHSLDKYGRPLGSIMLDKSGQDFASTMIEAGHAIRYYG